MLSAAQIERYSRQILLDPIGGRGQERLLAAAVAVVGAGPIGATAAAYLAGAGVGALVLIDDGIVTIDDVAGGALYTRAGLGETRVTAAGAAIAALNPDCRVLSQPERMTAPGAHDLAAGAALIVGAGGDPAERALLNRACIQARKPLVAGAAAGSTGWAAVFVGPEPDAPCVACAPALRVPVSAAAASPLVAGVIGTLLATEAVKLLLGAEPHQAGRVQYYDALAMTVRAERVGRNPHCAVCGAAERAARG